MAYLEVKKDGKVVERLRITLGDADSTCPVRIGNSQVRLALGEVKQVGEYEVALVDIPTADAVDEQSQEDLSAELASMVTSDHRERDVLLPSEDQRVTVMHGPRDAQESDAGAVSDSVESLLRDSDEPRYAERETIGKGGMGEIILCVERNTRRQVAMKRMLPTAAKLPRSRARFVEEAQVTAQLEHPNIVPVHELEMADDGAIYFTMKLVKGRSLAEILKAARDDEESPSLGQLLQIFLKVCDGVSFAHSRGVIHRDLKPANIMVGDFGEVLVMDWGVARILGREDIESDQIVKSSRQDLDQPELYTIAGKAMGSPAYMSPEQAAGDLDRIGPPSDVYSLGAILYEMLTLKRPVTGDTAKAVLAKVTRGQIAPPEKRAPERNIPRELSAVAMKCLSKTRQQRYQSIMGLHRDVSLFLEGRSVSADPDTFAQTVVKLLKRNRAVSISIAGAAAILIAVVSVAFIRVTSAMQRAINEREAAQTARDKQQATALAASEQLAGQAVRAAGEGRFAEADARADAAVKVMPDGPWGHYALGVVAFEKKDFVGARRHLEKATSLDLSHKPSRLFLASILVTSGELAKWEKLVAQADQATDWRSLVAAGDALMGAERHPQARKAYQKATELMARGAAVPANVRVEVNDKLARATACVKMAGFYESIRHLPAAQQALQLTAKLKEAYGPGLSVGTTVEKDSLAGVDINRNGDRVRWLDPLKGMPLTSLNCARTNVSDLGPLKGMPLSELDFGDTNVSDLTPLEGMPLTVLRCYRTRVSDLTLLKGMLLTSFNCTDTKVSDLTPLKGMPLQNLAIAATQVSDLTPLEGMPLTVLRCYTTRVSDLAPLKGMPLTSLECSETKVSDLTPLKGMKLTSLTLQSCSSLTSLRGIEGMPLTYLNIHQTKVTDLTPLKGMPLTTFRCEGTKVSDLTPLKGMSLTTLMCHSSAIADLTPLKGMKLTSLNLEGCSSLTSLRGIEGMPLTYLRCNGTQVSDLGPLKGTPLTGLNVAGTKVTDLTPLAGMGLQELSFTPKEITKGIEIVRGMKSIVRIGPEVDRLMDPDEFWKKYDAGDFNK